MDQNIPKIQKQFPPSNPSSPPSPHPSTPIGRPPMLPITQTHDSPSTLIFGAPRRTFGEPEQTMSVRHIDICLLRSTIRFKSYEFNLFQILERMADIIKIKAKKTYEWNQDKKFIYVQVPLPSHTSLKKVDIFLSDLILRVTSLEKKQTHFIDLAEEIDYRSPDNKFIVTDGLLHATLKKATPDVQWQKLLVEDISLADLKVRRRESELRHQQNVKTLEENKDKIRVDYDRKATQELMKFEQEERQKLENKKRIEKETAIREVFSNVNEKTGQFQKNQKQQKLLQIERAEEKWNAKQRLALSMLEKEEELEKSNLEKERKQKHQSKIIQEVTKKYQHEKAAVSNNTMFTEEEIDKYEELRNNIQEGVEYEQIPIRKAGTQKVKFTERIYKNLAARDHFHKEPPMPKNKANQLTNGDLESKNPLWLKDKGDTFFRDKNYISAIEAYSQSLKIDSKQLGVLMNRTLSFMKIFKFQEAINDCDQSLLLLQSQISGDQQEQAHSRLVIAKIKTRKAICIAWKGQLDSARSILKEVLELQLTQDIKRQVDQCLVRIKKREESIGFKAKGDELVKLNNPEAAIKSYQKAIEVDENEYAISNKVLCFNKVREFTKSLEEAERGIKRLLTFNVATSNSLTKEDKQASLILLKLYYRKAKALEEMGSLNEAEENIRKGLTINSEDKDLQEYLKTLKRKQNKQIIKGLKEEAASQIKQAKVKQALQNYGKCLKLLEEAEDIQQYLAILQNQCVCYQKLERYDDVLSTCIRILKLVNRIESKILEFGSKKQQAAIDKQDLKKISVRTLVRRANAYVKTSQYYNAKADLQKAYEINPEEAIKKQLDNLKSKLTEGT